MVFEKNVIIFFTILLISLDCFGTNNSLKAILKNDMLEKSNQEKKVNKFRKKTKKVSNANDIIDNKELERVIKNLWLIRNNLVLKWDKKLPDYGLKEVFEQTFKDFGIKSFNYKILFVHTNMVTHQMLKLSANEYVFVISKVLAELLDLSKQEISLLALEAYVRRDLDQEHLNGLTFSSLPGKNLKNELNEYIQKKLVEMDSMILNYKGSFSSEKKVLKNIFNGLSSQKGYLKAYRRMLGKVNELLRNDARFKFIASRYPSPEIKINWLKGMNVK